MNLDALPYRRIWALDFEFTAPSGGRPVPLCLVAHELRTGRLVRRWLTDDPPAAPPYSTSADDLFVAYYASAELGCHIALNWPMPARILDLHAEFRNLTSGLPAPHGHSLLGALAHHGLDALSAEEKEGMRHMAMRGGPYSAGERQALLDYCQGDVDALVRLVPAMLPTLDLPRALLRGRYMAAAARMEWAGVPIDTDTLGRLRKNWTAVKARLIAEIDKDYGIYDGTVFKRDWWGAYLERHSITWPRLDSGELALDDDTFREMARAYPAEVGPIRELRHTLGKLKLNDLAVGADGRNRTILSAFRSITGRNQPSNSKFIFGPSTWLRSLIKPGPGRALAYCDWSQQELAIAAALSGDTAMQECYRAGDFYLTFARMAGAVPAGATKESHGEVREQFKVVSLGVLYGLTEWGIARKLGVPAAEGRELLRMHRTTFRRFWRWIEDVEAAAWLYGTMRTVFGWRLHVTANTKPNTLRNYPCQANGAEMMRLAACLATERGIEVCAPVHDALLVEGPARLINDIVARTREAMREASELVLPGFPLRTDVKVVTYPQRYIDPRGKKMWETVQSILAGLGAGAGKGGDP
jgi:hypothetical protein